MNEHISEYNTYLFYFQQLGKCYPYQLETADSDLDIKVGDFVILDTEKGMEYSVAKKVYKDIKIRESFYIKKFIRKASSEDIETIKKIENLESQAYELCKTKGHELDLQMKLIKVKYLFDFSKVIFYFTANGRIDFRELVKQLAFNLKTRIEMRQIGIRDEAKILGGLGICGLHTCCNLFMSRFDPVSLKMARDQNLTCNPSRISGVCGRLMCCMYYEYSTYLDIKKDFPKIGYKIHHEQGIAEVTAINHISKKVWVKFSKDGKEIIMDLSSVKELEWEMTGSENEDEGMIESEEYIENEDSDLVKEAVPVSAGLSTTPEAVDKCASLDLETKKQIFYNKTLKKKVFNKPYNNKNRNKIKKKKMI